MNQYQQFSRSGVLCVLERKVHNLTLLREIYFDIGKFG